MTLAEFNQVNMFLQTLLDIDITKCTIDSITITDDSAYYYIHIRKNCFDIRIEIYKCDVIEFMEDGR